MFGLEYHGDTENISQRQFEFISEVLKNNGCAGKQVMVSTVGKSGDNYGAFVKRFSIDLEDDKVFKMIGKIAPSDYMIGNESPASDIFNNEALLYNEILPKFGKLQKSVGVPEEDRFRYPLCFGTLSEQSNEIILLEDLDVKKYVMLDKKQPLTNSVVKMVLQNLANFHSMSYVLKNKEPETYVRYLENMVNIFMNSNALPQTEMIFQAALNGIKSVFGDDQCINIIDDTIKTFIHTYFKMVSAEQGSKYGIIQHGDLWTNNIMFQMQGDQGVECMFIDYQMVRENLPVADIFNLIFNCTDYETRSKHYYEWIDYYHLELSKYLHYFGFEVNNVYSRDKLDVDLLRYAKPCLGASMMMINFLLRESEEAPDTAIMFEIMDETKMAATDFGIKNLTGKTVEAMRKRVKGLINSCLEYGYLSNMPNGSFK